MTLYEGIDRLGEIQGLTAMVRERIIRLVIERKINPGERLNEVHLANMLGISRGPVREAARELVGLGYLVAHPRRGFYVVTFTRRQAAELAVAKKMIDHATLTNIPAELRAPLATAMLARLDQVSLRNRGEFAEAFLKLRLDMVGQIGNQLLAELAAIVFRKLFIMTAIVRLENPQARMNKLIDAYRRSFIALREGDVAAAYAALESDTNAWCEEFMDLFPETEGKDE